MRALFWAAVAALIGAAFWLWLERPLVVTVATLSRGDAAEIVYATGVVEPVRWAEITALSRARIVETCACEGAPVARGEALFRLDDSAERAHLAELEARLALAEKALARIEPLFERQVAARDAYDEASAKVSELAAAVAVAESRMQDLTLRSPLDGIVLRLDGEPGEVAEPGLALGWVGQPRPLRVTADVNEEDAPRLRPGQQALVQSDAFPGVALRATLDSITPMGDPDLKTWRVRLALPDDTKLMIGMSVDVNIVERVSPGALLAPAAALLDGALFVVEDGRLRRAPVTVGIAGPAFVEIVAGAEEGMVVVSPAADDLVEGRRVRVASDATPDAAPGRAP